MVVVNNGLEKIASVVAVDLSTGEWGDDNTTPSQSDTDLISAVAGTSKSLQKTTSGQTIQLTHELGLSSGNSNTLKEFGNKFTDSTLLNRVISGDIIKTSSLIVTTISTVSFKNG